MERLHSRARIDFSGFSSVMENLSSGARARDLLVHVLFVLMRIAVLKLFTTFPTT